MNWRAIPVHDKEYTSLFAKSRVSIRCSDLYSGFYFFFLKYFNILTVTQFWCTNFERQ